MSIDSDHKINQAFEGQPMSETPDRTCARCNDDCHAKARHLERQNAALLADARRYRGLRDGSVPLVVVSNTGTADVGQTGVVGTYEEEFTGAELDDAIDAALARQGERG